MTHSSLRHRFPSLDNRWARFDGPAGTQVVDTSVEATTAWMSGTNNGCTGGVFAASIKTGEMVERARAVVAQLFGADPAGICFGANMTTLTFSMSRAIGATLGPGDRIVGTRLDHDANITPWARACEQAGATHLLAPFDAASGTLPPENVIALIDERTKWVTLPGASNLLGTAPDLKPIIEAAHAVGARVFVDAVALAPHRQIEVGELGCDALVTSPYKWYGPHSGMLWIEPELLDSLPMFKVRPAHDQGPSRFETGMPNFEAIAGVEAAARFLLEEGMASLMEAETELFAQLLTGLQAISGVTVYGPTGLEGRTPTAAFTVQGTSPADVSVALAAQHVAVWDGHNYAVEVVDSLGLAETGGVVRAGISRYIEPEDVSRLLVAVQQLTRSG